MSINNCDYVRLDFCLLRNTCVNFQNFPLSFLVETFGCRRWGQLFTIKLDINKASLDSGAITKKELDRYRKFLLCLSE